MRRKGPHETHLDKRINGKGVAELFSGMFVAFRHRLSWGSNTRRRKVVKRKLYHIILYINHVPLLSHSKNNLVPLRYVCISKRIFH